MSTTRPSRTATKIARFMLLIDAVPRLAPVLPEDAARTAEALLRASGAVPTLGLIRFGGHLSCGGYDVQTDGRHTEAPRAAAVH